MSFSLLSRTASRAITAVWDILSLANSNYSQHTHDIEGRPTLAICVKAKFETDAGELCEPSYEIVSALLSPTEDTDVQTHTLLSRLRDAYLAPKSTSGTDILLRAAWNHPALEEQLRTLAYCPANTDAYKAAEEQISMHLSVTLAQAFRERLKYECYFRDSIDAQHHDRALIVPAHDILVGETQGSPTIAVLSQEMMERAKSGDLTLLFNARDGERGGVGTPTKSILTFSPDWYPWPACTYAPDWCFDMTESHRNDPEARPALDALQHLYWQACTPDTPISKRLEEIAAMGLGETIEELARGGSSDERKLDEEVWSCAAECAGRAGSTTEQRSIDFLNEQLGSYAFAGGKRSPGNVPLTDQIEVRSVPVLSFTMTFE